MQADNGRWPIDLSQCQSTGQIGNALVAIGIQMTNLSVADVVSVEDEKAPRSGIHYAGQKDLTAIGAVAVAGAWLEIS
jgi:hypothetical protein